MKKLDLEKAIELINRDFGKGAIMSMDGDNFKDINSISTGSMKIDDILGGNGVPRGRIVEIYGAESSGKTTLALQIIAHCHRENGVAAFIDAEHALDPKYAKNIGVNLKKLYLSQPSCGEEALEITERLIKTGNIDVIVIDSVAALVPKVELECSMGESQVGLQARLMSKAMRKITGALARSETVVIFINQIRDKIGVMFGPKTTTSGGRALKFFSSIRIEVKKKEIIKDQNLPIGNKTLIKVVKNKVAPPFRETIVELYYGEGICPFSEFINLGIENEIISKSGTWFSYKTIRLGQGFQAARKFLKLNGEILQNIKKDIEDKGSLNSEMAAWWGIIENGKVKVENEELIQEEYKEKARGNLATECTENTEF